MGWWPLPWKLGLLGLNLNPNPKILTMAWTACLDCLLAGPPGGLCIRAPFRQCIYMRKGRSPGLDCFGSCCCCRRRPGRCRYALQKHGSAKLARLLGVGLDVRGRGAAALRAAVEAAEAVEAEATAAAVPQEGQEWGQDHAVGVVLLGAEPAAIADQQKPRAQPLGAAQQQQQPGRTSGAGAQPPAAKQAQHPPAPPLLKQTRLQRRQHR